MPSKNQTQKAEPSVTLRVQLPSNLAIQVAEGHEVQIDLAALSQNAEALRHVLLYGIGRFTRDGTTKVKEGKELRDATPQERKDLAEAKWARLFEGRLRERVSSADPVLSEMRTLTLRYLVKAGTKAKDIGKLPDRDAVRKALAAHAGVYEKVVKRATALAEMKSEEL